MTGPVCREQDREDLARLASIVDWSFIRKLLNQGGLRWLGYRWPRPIRSRLDPFGESEILALEDRAIV